MNDPNDIIVAISLDKEEENNSLYQSFGEENKEMMIVKSESNFNKILFHLYEKLSKRLYKKTIKEIDILIENNYFQGSSLEWKLPILKIRVFLKVINRKIIKYLIYHYDKVKIKQHIYTIKKIFQKISNEFNLILEHLNSNICNNANIVDDLLLCYFEYIYQISFFHKKLGNMIESISYLSFSLKLYKETRLIVKSVQTISKIIKFFILLSQILIYNEDFYSCFNYLNIAMDLCLKNIIYLNKDSSDGIFLGDKKGLKNSFEQNSYLLNKSKIENEIEDNFGDKKIKKNVINIVYIYLYRGICYENIGKIKNSIRCYYQCLWFLNYFFINSFRNLKILIHNILEKSLEFKEAIDYINKAIYYNQLQLKMKNQLKKDNGDKENKKEKKRNLSNYLYSNKFKGLVNRLNKFKINEIENINKFEIKKNIKELNYIKREGEYKNIFLSDIRLLNTYLREDFKNIIDHMDKIKSYDFDYQTREKIQKLIRIIYFEQSQRKLKNKSKNKFFNSSTIEIRNSNRNIKNNNYPLLKKETIMKNIRNKSASARLKNKTDYSSNTTKYISKNNVINYKNDNKSNKKLKKEENIKETKNIRLNSEVMRKKRIYEENKELNNFFNKKYTLKRNYIKKLADRELSFQKSLLRLKNIPKTPIQMYNKELIKENANYSFQKIMSLLISTPNNWKENFSEKEVKDIIAYDKLENSVIKSLDKSALIKFKEEEEKKQKKNNYNNIDSLKLSLKNVYNNNKNLIDQLNINLEELRHREIIENKNYKNLLIENWKYLRNRNERNGQHFNSSCIVCRNKYENNVTKSKKMYSSSCIY